MIMITTTVTRTSITGSSTTTTRTCSRCRSRLDGDVDPAKFMPWINRVTQEQGLNILRCKGIVAMKNDAKRFVFQGVHMMLDGDLQREWRPGEKRESKVVFIGRNLEEDDIRKGFLACAA